MLNGVSKIFLTLIFVSFSVLSGWDPNLREICDEKQLNFAKYKNLNKLCIKKITIEKLINNELDRNYKFKTITQAEIINLLIQELDLVLEGEKIESGKKFLWQNDYTMTFFDNNNKKVAGCRINKNYLANNTISIWDIFLYKFPIDNKFYDVIKELLSIN